VYKLRALLGLFQIKCLNSDAAVLNNVMYRHWKKQMIVLIVLSVDTCFLGNVFDPLCSMCEVMYRCVLDFVFVSKWQCSKVLLLFFFLYSFFIQLYSLYTFVILDFSFIHTFSRT